MLSFTLDPIRRDKNEFHTETVLIFLCIHSVYLSVFFSFQQLLFVPFFLIKNENDLSRNEKKINMRLLLFNMNIECRDDVSLCAVHVSLKFLDVPAAAF